VVVRFHGFIPLVNNGVNDDVEDSWRDDVALCDASFRWERCSKNSVLMGDDGVGVPEILKKS